jgi:uncharacterized membrane protein YbhN (UPF0104 family)
MHLPPATTAPANAHAAAHRRRHFVNAAKLLLAVAILAVLVHRLQSENVFSRLINEPKHWGLLGIAQLLIIAGLALNYIRWCILGRALALNFDYADAFRLGSLGLLLNQVSPGAVGGDLFKAVFIAREQPGKRTEAVASVLIDRVVGLYGMLCVAAVGYAIVSRHTDFTGLIRGVADAVVVCWIVGTIGVGLLMTPWFTGPAMRGLFDRIPLVGGTLARLVDAAGAYRHHRASLFAGILLGCITHTLFAIALWCVGQGLPMTSPPLSTMFVITPMSLAAGAIPLTPSGLGVAEAAIGQLFQSAGFNQADGYLAGITYRVMTYVMAAVGAVYYVSARRAVTQVLQEAEQAADNDSAS